ncbi:MFS transporter [Paenirhodobacter sp.]|uniref:MFS transporter n=1 Tax=Paenirhodobacter sp. TaxID=1965326 RepID=UPI003B405A39
MARRSTLLLGFLMLCGFAVVGQLYATIPLVADIAARFNVAPGSAALAGSAFGLAYAAGFLIFGPLSDRYGRKRVIVIGLVATTLITVLVGMAQSFGLLLVARAAQGLAASTFPPAALSLVAEDLPPAHRPLGISLMSFAFLGAAPVAQFFAGEVSALPAIMFAVTPLYLVGAAGLLFTAQADRRSAAMPGSNPAPKAGLRALLGNPAILSGWLAAITVLFGFVAFHSGAQALNGGLDLDLQTLRLVGLPPLLLTLAAAPITRRFGPSVTARVGLIVMAGALAFAATGTAGTVLAASVILSSGVALAVPGLIATIASQATNENRGLALAIYTFSLFLGASIAPPVAQALASHGTGPLWLLPAVLLAVAIAVLTLSIRRKPSPAPATS